MFKFEAAMDDDFNTADAISAVFELVKLANTTASEKDSQRLICPGLKETIEKLCDVLGIITEKKEEILDGEIEEMIARRQQARKDKNFALADRDPRRASGEGNCSGGYKRGRKMEASLNWCRE